MDQKANHTFAEITSQAKAWAEALSFLHTTADHIQKEWARLNPRQVLFIGCGSTYYLSQSAAALCQGTVGIPARACPSSELLLFIDQIVTQPDQTLLVAISRSGITTETLSAINRFRQAGGAAVWGITCYPKQTLAQVADLVLVAEAAQEQSVAQTRSFASMLLLAQGLTAIIAGKPLAAMAGLPDLGQELIQRADTLVQQWSQQSGLDRFYFLGSGIQYGLANEAMLKMKEMSLSHSEGFHFLEFRHGPISMVDESTLVIGLLSRQAIKHEKRVLAEVTQLGASTLPLAPASISNENKEGIYLDPALPTWCIPVLYLPALQLLAYYRAIGKGLDPDNPRHLNAVVHLEAADFAQD
jgi:glucosamine--fructose-6-phosphate aminotransferase (isomerizing)